MKRPTVEQWDAGYGRIFTDMQMERDALQNQVQALEAYAAAAHALKLRLCKDDRGHTAAQSGQPSLLSGLVECICGTEMYSIHSYVTTKRDGTAWATTAAGGPATRAHAPPSRCRPQSWSASSSTSCAASP